MVWCQDDLEVTVALLIGSAALLLTNPGIAHLSKAHAVQMPKLGISVYHQWIQAKGMEGERVNGDNSLQGSRFHSSG